MQSKKTSSPGYCPHPVTVDIRGHFKGYLTGTVGAIPNPNPMPDASISPVSRISKPYNPQQAPIPISPTSPAEASRCSGPCPGQPGRPLRRVQFRGLGAVTPGYEKSSISPISATSIPIFFWMDYPHPTTCPDIFSLSVKTAIALRPINLRVDQAFRAKEVLHGV